ncbi:MAG: prepilin-type N-terminal cleavage/methylation domain-containing protein [Candidatus Adlerbacteria bacterium]
MTGKKTHMRARGPARRQAGFTLVETLLAILILTTAIAGPLTIAAKGLSLALIAKDQVAATFLAQDAVEYVRFIRDTNRLSNNSDWLAGLDGGNNGHTTSNSGAQPNCTNGNACVVDSLQDLVSNCGLVTTGCASMPLYFDQGNQYYTYVTAGNTQTIFSRTISIQTPSQGGNTSEAELTVLVQWKDVGGVVRSVVLRENLLNWQ